jgi:hypothetical protein
VPSYLAFAHLLPEAVLKPVAEFTKASNTAFGGSLVAGAVFPELARRRNAPYLPGNALTERGRHRPKEDLHQ